MSYLWKAEVSFTGVWRRTLDQAGVCKLPNGETKLSDLVVTDLGADQYKACLELESGTLIDAKKRAIAKVEKLLQILATGNDLFEIDFSSVRAVVTKEVSEAENEISRTQGGLGVKLHGQVHLSSHLSFQKLKENLNFEYSSLESVDCWPVHLQRGMALNYSAVRAPSHSVGFLLTTAALEVLTWKKLGSPASMLNAVLTTSDQKKFKTKFKEFAADWGFDDGQIVRLCENLSNTKNFPVARHLRCYLESVGIGESVADTADLARWWKLRGKLAHGEVVEQEEIQSDFNRLVITTQLALRRELELVSVQ